mgnify:CR=1 FL=1
MTDPGDYYRRKQVAADEAERALSRHQLDDCLGAVGCMTCKRLVSESLRLRDMWEIEGGVEG